MKMRKVLSALLVAACTLSLAACGSSSSKNETTGASGETAAVPTQQRLSMWT